MIRNGRYASGGRIVAAATGSDATRSTVSGPAAAVSANAVATARPATVIVPSDAVSTVTSPDSTAAGTSAIAR